MDAIFLNGGIYRPETLNRSIGPYKISHWLRKHGYQCQVIEYCDRLTEDQICLALSKFVSKETKIIALSSTFLANGPKKFEIASHIINALKKTKDANPHVKIVIGGWFSEIINSYSVFDASIMSYGGSSEDIFLEYMQYLHKKSESPLGKLISVHGDTKMRMWYDTARFSKYNIEHDDFKFVEQDCILPKEPLPLDISRGCIFACKFCSFLHLGKKKYDYVRNLKVIEDEINYNYEKFQTTNYYILDDTFNDTIQKLEEFNTITNSLSHKINYTAYIRADLVHRFPESAELLQNSGLVGCIFGIESLHPEASRIIGKAWSGKHAREFIPKLHHDIWKNKITTTTNIIVGLPQDTEENCYSTKKWFIENELSFITFTGLYLSHPSLSSNHLKSEFSRNYKEYGIEHVFDDNNNWLGWKHGEFWNSHKANSIANVLNQEVRPYLKNHSWIIPSLLWYGLDSNIQSEIEIKNKILLNQYFNLLMNL